MRTFWKFVLDSNTARICSPGPWKSTATSTAHSCQTLFFFFFSAYIVREGKNAVYDGGYIAWRGKRVCYIESFFTLNMLGWFILFIVISFFVQGKKHNYCWSYLEVLLVYLLWFFFFFFYMESACLLVNVRRVLCNLLPIFF